jgi:hypothetical protein
MKSLHSDTLILGPNGAVSCCRYWKGARSAGLIDHPSRSFAVRPWSAAAAASAIEEIVAQALAEFRGEVLASIPWTENSRTATPALWCGGMIWGLNI